MHLHSTLLCLCILCSSLSQLTLAKSHSHMNSNSHTSLHKLKKQCLYTRDIDILKETCPVYSQETIDFSAALFPDPAVISVIKAAPPISNKGKKDDALEKPGTATTIVLTTPTSSSTPSLASLTQSSTPNSSVQDASSESLKSNTAAQNEQTLIANNEIKENNNKQSSIVFVSKSDDESSSSDANNDAEQERKQRNPIVSFEEWQKKVLENEKEKRNKRRTGSLVDDDEGVAVGGIRGVDGRRGGHSRRQQMVDSLDGGFGDDFGAMFEELIGGSAGKDRKEPNVYAERDYIAPSPSAADDGGTPKTSSKKDKKLFNDARVKSLKERFNYASTDCAATVRKANKQAKGAQSILYESKDQYLLNKCSADKFVIINLCEQIVVDTIVMANFEFFSSTFKDFRVYASSKYPTDEWHLLGQWQARNTRDLQVFRVPESGFVEYIKIEFLTHYGHEYYCPLSLVRVHGMSMMEYYTIVESQDQDPVWEGEHLWPAEVREQIIQPQFDITNTSETFPVKNDAEEEEVKLVIPPMEYVIVDDTLTEADNEITESDYQNKEDYSAHKTNEDSAQLHRTQEEDSVKTTEDIPLHSSDVLDASSNYVQLSKEYNASDTLGISHNVEDQDTSMKQDVNDTSTEQILSTQDDEDKDHSIIHSSSITPSQSIPTLVSVPVSQVLPNYTDSIEVQSVHYNDNNEQIPTNSPETTVSTMPSVTSQQQQQQQQQQLTVAAPPAVISTPVKPSSHPKEGNTQESIYKTIMKRLNQLELNMTLSQRYLEDQNQILNDVFLDMERKHQEQLIILIGHLNETASFKIESMKRRYEQWYEDLKEQTESELKEMTSKITLLTDQISFERRVSVTQLVIMVTLFVFMALSRGTFSPLSPVMAAQQEERKRRESIDLSSASALKLDLASALKKDVNNVEQKPLSEQRQPSTTPKTGSAVSNEKHTEQATTSHIVTADSTVPKLKDAPSKKPNHPRRHSDSPYHLMARESDRKANATNESKDKEYMKPHSSSDTVDNSQRSTRKQMSFESLGIRVQDDNDFLKQLDDALMQQQKQAATAGEIKPNKEEAALSVEQPSQQEVPLLDNDMTTNQDTEEIEPRSDTSDSRRSSIKT